MTPTKPIVPKPSIQLAEQAIEIIEMVATLTENTARIHPKGIPQNFNIVQKKEGINGTMEVVMMCIEKAKTTEEVEKCRKIIDRADKVFERFSAIERNSREVSCGSSTSSGM